ncbi:MAG: DUF2182 domain-containing protein [Gemmobacter sp.]|nr:DUF2182 domain-containing protein [Gemmobacter sp.]
MLKRAGDSLVFGLSGRVVGWVWFYGVVLLAWAALWAMGQDPRVDGSAFGLALLADLCGAGADSMGYRALFSMWAVMSVAMMAPTAVPAIVTWTRLPGAASGGASGTFALIAGYLAVWLGASGLFAVAQSGLTARGLLGANGASLSGWLTAALFAAAGAYQFSRLKEACLSRCRMPLTFFMERWRPGVSGALMAGVRLGLVCLGCCWALMALAFVGGMTNLLWMGLATALMVMEKLPDIGRPLTRPLGWALLAAAAVTGVFAYGGLL